MKTIFLSLLSLSYLIAQPPPPYQIFTTPQYAVPQKFSGVGAPGVVPGNLAGDIFINTTNGQTYICSAPQGTVSPSCSTVATGQWVLLGSGSGSTTFCAGTGTNAITCTGNPVPTSYTTGMIVSLTAGGTNTAAVTINISSLGAKTVQQNGSSLSAGVLINGNTYLLYYDGTNFQLAGSSGGGGTGVGAIYNNVAQVPSAATNLRVLYPTGSADQTPINSAISAINAAGGGDLWLLPLTPVTTSGSVTSNSTALTISSGTATANSQYIAGPGVIPGTTVSSGGGTTSIVISQAAGYALVSGTYTSGITASGSTSQTCVLRFSGYPSASATVALTGTNTIAGGTSLVITTPGLLVSVPTTATVLNGSATCSGTATVALTSTSSFSGSYTFYQPYVISTSIVPKSNVRVHGVQPGLADFDASGASNDFWVFSGAGTLIVGPGSSVDCIAANTTPNSNAAEYQTYNALSYATIEGLGLTNCKRGINIGAQNSPGLYWSHLRDIYATGNADWGIYAANFSESSFDRLFTNQNNTGAVLAGEMDFTSTVNVSVYAPGNSTFNQLYCAPLNQQSRAITFTATGADNNSESTLGSLTVSNLQTNRFAGGIINQTWTPSNSSTSVSVPDLTKVVVGMPWFPTSTADGYTTNVTYFVLSVSGTSGSGTITLGTSEFASSAITATGSTSINFTSAGFPELEFAGSQQTSPASAIQGVNVIGLDLEGGAGQSTSGLYLERLGSGMFAFQGVSLSGNSGGVTIRSSSNMTIIASVGAYMNLDFDGSGNGNTWTGPRGTPIQYSMPGIFYDNSWGGSSLNLSSYTTQTQTGADAYLRYGTNQYFIYPNRPWGETLRTRDFSVNLGAQYAGDVIFNGGSGQTLTLPVIDSTASPGNTSVQGLHFKVSNASTSNSLGISTSSSQTFNNVTGLTSVSLPPQSVVEFTAARTSTGAIEYWVCSPSVMCSGLNTNGIIFSAAGTPLPGTTGGNAACSGYTNLTAFVSDATLPAIGMAYVSGGAVYAGVICNGTSWLTY